MKRLTLLPLVLVGCSYMPHRNYPVQYEKFQEVVRQSNRIPNPCYHKSQELSKFLWEQGIRNWVHGDSRGKHCWVQYYDGNGLRWMDATWNTWGNGLRRR